MRDDGLRRRVELAVRLAFACLLIACTLCVWVAVVALGGAVK
jgi:hypothetical protein